MSTMRGFLEVTSGKKWTCDPRYQVEGILGHYTIISNIQILM